MSKEISSPTSDDDMLPMWAVYVDPDDFQGEMVARKWLVGSLGYFPTEELIRVKAEGDLSHLTPDQFKGIQLAAIREAIQARMPGAVCLARSPEDEAQILETWL